MPTLPQRLLLASCLAAAACGGAVTGPALTIEPLTFGGDHGGLLETMLGDAVAYRVQRTGGAEAGCRVRAVVYSQGTQVAASTFLAFVLPGDAEFTLALIALEPEDDLENMPSHRPRTELFLGLDFGGTRLLGSALVEGWDALAGEEQVTTIAEWRETTTIPFDADAPVPLWRCTRSKSVPMRPISAPRADDVDGVLEVTIEIDG